MNRKDIFSKQPRLQKQYLKDLAKKHPASNNLDQRSD